MRDDAPSRVELLQGTRDLLRTLLAGPAHRHAIAKTGPSYPALHRLEAKGWMTPTWEPSNKDQRARFYRLTPLGRRQFAAEQWKWTAFFRAIALILNPVNQEAQ